jgi:hypothetical protein
MQQALQRAACFLDAHGTALDRARLAAFRGEGAEPAREAVEALQREDGSFPALPGCAPGAATRTTAAALEVLAEIRVRRARSVEHAVAFLGQTQSPDGSWGEGATELRLASSGRVGAALGRTVYARPEVLASAGDFLGRHFAPERVEGGEWDALAGVAAFFTNVDHERGDDVLQWCGRALEKGFRSHAFSAVRTARVLTLCDAGGLPGASVDPAELVMGMLAEQVADGGWPAPDEIPGGRAEATLAAAFALVRLGSSSRGG